MLASLLALHDNCHVVMLGDHYQKDQKGDISHGDNWGYVFKLQEKLYLMGVVLTYYRILMSFKALRADLSKGNMAWYIIIPKTLN
mgnify:CR=1 FL=1